MSRTEILFGFDSNETVSPVNGKLGLEGLFVHLCHRENMSLKAD